MSKVRASFVFTPWEGRRIIGKAVAALPALGAVCRALCAMLSPLCQCR